MSHTHIRSCISHVVFFRAQYKHKSKKKKSGNFVFFFPQSHKTTFYCKLKYNIYNK